MSAKKPYPRIPILCACGCNEVVWTGRTYKLGHNNRINHPMLGKHQTQEAIERTKNHPNSIASRRKKGEWKPTPEMISNMSKAHIGLQAKEKHPLWKGDRELYGIYRRNQQKKSSQKYKQSHKKQEQKYHREYRLKNKSRIKLYQSLYDKTPHGKITRRKIRCKRQRELEYYPYNEVFNNSHGHHLDYRNVIHIPEELHNAYRHRQTDEESMTRINILAWVYLESSSY